MKPLSLSINKIVAPEIILFVIMFNFNRNLVNSLRGTSF